MSLTSAFAFADSLTHGACGHKAIELDRVSWNVLVRACVYRGAMMRALEILNDTMPNNGIDPDKVTYNTILSGLARVVSKDRVQRDKDCNDKAKELSYHLRYYKNGIISYH